MKERGRVLGLCILVAACGVSPLSPREIGALGRAERQWANRSFQNYAFELRRGCFCPLEFTQWARVDVVAGRVTRVVILASGAEQPAAQLHLFQTVEQIFEEIRTAAANDWVKDVVAEFDASLGFPTYVGVSLKPNVQDGDVTYYLRNARPLS